MDDSCCLTDEHDVPQLENNQAKLRIGTSSCCAKARKRKSSGAQRWYFISWVFPMTIFTFYSYPCLHFEHAFVWTPSDLLYSLQNDINKLDPLITLWPKTWNVRQEKEGTIYTQESLLCLWDIFFQEMIPILSCSLPWCCDNACKPE